MDQTMPGPLALHTAARRYCYDRAPGLRPPYEAELLDDESDDGAAATDLAQWHVCADVLLGLEALDPHPLAPIEELRRAILQVGETATSAPLDWKPNREIAVARARERERFRDYVMGLTAQDLARVPPLPYRRVMSHDELRVLQVRLASQWDLNAVERMPVSPEAICVNKYMFDERVSWTKTREWLAGHGIDRIWQIPKSPAVDPPYEMDLIFLDLDAEWDCYWTSEGMDWIVYRSHEEAMKIGGQWLIDRVVEEWPYWN